MIIMKAAKFLFIFIATMLMEACNNQQKLYTIVGELPDSSYNGKTVYLCDINSNANIELNSSVKIDSTIVEGNIVRFEGIAPDTAFNCRINVDYHLFTFLILEAGNIVIDFANQQSSGTPLNDEVIRIDKYLYDWRCLLDKVREKLKGKDDEFETFYREEHLPIAINQLKEDFLSHSDDAVGYYMMAEFRLGFEMNKFMCDNCGPWLRNKKRVKSLIEQVNAQQATAEGKIFSDFKGSDVDGNIVSLSDYVGKGNYVLIDFWASWCSPCHKEIPNLKQLHQKYKDKGLTIIGVYVWDSAENMKTALKEEQITWPQIVDSEDEATYTYGVTAIPHIILFGPDGTILKRDIRGERMIRTVSRYFEAEQQ